MVFALMMATLMQEGKGGLSQESNYWQESLKQHEKTYIGFNLHAPLAVASKVILKKIVKNSSAAICTVA